MIVVVGIVSVVAVTVVAVGVSVAVVVAVIDIKGSMISVAWSKIKNARKREKGCKKISEKIQNVSAISIINICDLLV